jgi:hypothetical protein
MPQLPDAIGCLKVLIKGTNNGNPWLNSLHYMGVTGVPDNAALTTLAATVASAWTAHIAPIMATTVQRTEVQVIDIGRRDGATGYDTTSAPGTATGNTPLPVNVAICVSESVQYRWRGGHPRFYLPAPFATSTEGGDSLTVAAQTSANQAVDAFFDALNGATVPAGPPKLACVRFYDNHAMLTTPIVLEVRSFRVKKRLDSQRRRLGKEIV